MHVRADREVWAQVVAYRSSAAVKKAEREYGSTEISQCNYTKQRGVREKGSDAR